MTLGWARNRLAELDSTGLFQGAEHDIDPDYGGRKYMQVNLTTEEAQALLDGINVVINEKAKDIGFFSEHLPRSKDRDKVLAELNRDLSWAKSAREKIQRV